MVFALVAFGLILYGAIIVQGVFDSPFSIIYYTTALVMLLIGAYQVWTQ